MPGGQEIEVKGGPLNSVRVLWLGDSHAKRMFRSVPDNTPIPVGYAWLTIKRGWETVLDDIVAQVAGMNVAPRVFLSIGGRLIGLSGMRHNQVLVYILEIVKKWSNQGVDVTVMELPFSREPRNGPETWRTTCAIRGINTHLLNSSPAAGLLTQSVTTRGDRSTALGLGGDFPMFRDTAKFADGVHLRDQFYMEVAEATLREYDANRFSDPKEAWTMVEGAVQRLEAPPGLEESWEEFLNGGRKASEVQLWNPEELWVTRQPLQQFGMDDYEFEDWQQNPSSRGMWRPRARGRGSRGSRGRGYGGRGRGWRGSSQDRRPQGIKRYIFN